MRVVLYAEDFEPITVIELTEFAVGHLQTHGAVRLAVPSPVQYLSAPLSPSNLHLAIVTIRAEKLRRAGRNHMMLFTGDEESALMLKSAFLPGQRKDVQSAQKQAFAQGFLSALSRLT